MKRSVFLALFLLLAPAIVQAKTEKITGAFGITLGQKFDTSTAIGKGSLTDGTPMYQFSPQNPFRSFKRYYVLITPKTNKVYAIWGIGDMENNEIAKNEQAVIITILQKKYGKEQEQGLMASMYDARTIDQGNRYVMVKTSGITDVTIDIRYYDKALEKLAEKERIEIEAGKANSSGL